MPLAPPDGAGGTPVEFNTGGAIAMPDIDGEPAFQRATVFADLPGKAGMHAPALAAYDDGELIAACYAYEGPHELDGSGIYLANRDPAGGGWSQPRLHVDRPEGDGNPVLFVESEQAWLFQAVVAGGWSTSQVVWQRSDDRGETWTPAKALGGPLGTNVRFPPLRLQTGELLLPAYDDLLQRSLFFASVDGESWTLRSALFTAPPHQNLQPSIVELDDGQLLGVLRNGGGGWLWATASDDGGYTWLSPGDAGFANPNSPALLLHLRSGRLLMVLNDSQTARRPLVATLSADGGHTWTEPRVLVDGEGAYAYPAGVQAFDGLIHVAYSHERERIDVLSFNESWVVGAERGQ